MQTTNRIRTDIGTLPGIGNTVRLLAAQVIIVGIVVGSLLAMQSRTTSAASDPPAATEDSAPPGAYQRWLWLKCVDEEVEEGDSFRLEVRRKGGISSHLSPTMRVKWYTDAGTADESDYHALDGNTQASNSYQSRVGKMGRTLYTREDNLKEPDETYTVRIENAGNEDNSDSCTVSIIDDDTGSSA
ncbi:MAG: hypothetical protein F4X34_01945 [Chloroflexi bacterium]|nr:hypothetical protein [Chloroflexota bacterium]